MSDFHTIFNRAASLHEKIVEDVPQLRRGMVWCRKCGHSEKVNSASALRHGWPMHCGETMTIDSPEERASRAPLQGEPS